MRRLLIIVFLLILMLVFGSTPPPPVQAATNINVTTPTDELTTNGQCSLREAITLVNGGVAADCGILGTAPHTINIPVGTYTITIGNTWEDGNLDGDFDVTTTDEVIFSGADKTTTIIEASTVQPADPLPLGHAEWRVFHVISTNTTTFADLTVRHGIGWLTVSAGGIYHPTGVVHLQNVDISHNIMGGNAGSGLGAGGIVADEIIVENSSFAFNEVYTGDLGTGGAISANKVTITNATFSDNQTHLSWSAGAVYTTEMSISDSTFSDNYFDIVGSSNSAGAIYYDTLYVKLKSEISIPLKSLHINAKAPAQDMFEQMRSDLGNNTRS